MLAIKAKALEPDHPDVAASVDNLAHHYQSQGTLEEALKDSRRYVAIRIGWNDRGAS